MRTIGIIPARYQSSRFPGKLLEKVFDKTLLQLTYENALRMPFLDALYIATDDARLYDHAASLGAQVLMTSPTCVNGTARLVEALERYDLSGDLIVNLQGDEPCIDPAVVEKSWRLLLERPDAALTTAVAPIDPKAWLCPSHVKALLDNRGRVLYFSRAPIPYQGPSHAYLHLGLYCYRREFLLQYNALPDSSLQMCEDLEQLRVLQAGYPLYAAVVPEGTIGVNTPLDLENLKNYLCEKGPVPVPVPLPVPEGVEMFDHEKMV